MLGACHIVGWLYGLTFAALFAALFVFRVHPLLLVVWERFLLDGVDVVAVIFGVESLVYCHADFEVFSIPYGDVAEASPVFPCDCCPCSVDAEYFAICHFEFLSYSGLRI